RPDLRVIVLTGAGRAFCSGGDVKEIIGRLQGRSDEETLAFTRLTCETVLRILEAPQIVIASLNGVTAGAGAALALASDFRIACGRARAGSDDDQDHPEPRAGIQPGRGARGGGRSAGDLHEASRLQGSVSGVPREAEAGVRGKAVVMSSGMLTESERELAALA